MDEIKSDSNAKLEEIIAEWMAADKPYWKEAAKDLANIIQAKRQNVAKTRNLVAKVALPTREFPSPRAQRTEKKVEGRRK